MKLFDIIFPRRCVNCGRVGKYFCDECRRTIRAIHPNESVCPMCEKPAVGGYTHPGCSTRYALDGLTSFFHYDGPIRKAVKDVKYRFVSDLIEEFVALVPDATFPRATLIPIPLHTSRFKYRGFNQAERLGVQLAKRLNVTIRTDILRRVRPTIPQVEMKKRKERLENMQNVFVANRPPRNILLFDDVFTTGATMRAAANVLKRAGATFVWAVSMAR